MKTPRIACFILLAAAGCLFTMPTHADDKEGFIKLFNGKDLANFYTYLGAPSKGEKPYGKNNDPEKVFTVHDGMIHVTGKVFGCFTTEKEYENYHLLVEFKWGEKTWAPRENRARDSGILLHCQGADGSFGVWMPSIECQMIEGGTGDFLVLSNKDHKFTLTVEAEKRSTGEGDKVHDELYYKKGGDPLTKNGGRINWYGRSPVWKDVAGFRGKEDVEKPVGEWNTLEVICDRDSITNVLNGKVVNAGTKASPSKGKIIFQSEGAEVFFRRIDLKPLKK